MVQHSVFGNITAAQTHPLDSKKPCYLAPELEVPKEKKVLQLKVIHHPHGDWRLRMLAGKDQLVSAETATDEWLDVTVDLSKYAGPRINCGLKISPMTGETRGHTGTP